MARLLWIFLGSVLLWSCGPFFSVLGLDNDDVRAKATDIVVARGVSRKLLQQNAADAEAKQRIEEDKLKSEIEKEILAQVEEKFKQAMHLEKDTQAVQQKADAVVEDAEKRRKEEEEQRKRIEEEAERKRKEEEEKKRKEEEERKRKEEEERKRKEEEERKRKEEEERKRKEEEERRKKEEEEAKKQKEEEAKRRKEEEERRKREEEEERKQKEQEEEMNFQHILDTKIIPELKQRCSTFPKWTAPQVERCLSFAEDGIEYDPLIFDLDDDDFSSLVVKPTLNSIGHQHGPTSALKFLLKVAFLIALVVAYLRHVNWFRKNRLWNAMILKSRTLLFHVSKHKQQNHHHRHAG
ncbi:Stress response protein nst1 [Picochlorum sp. SENEW3]|nr:Stress response protein nst1 [Picochlorum sp. SENEW3]WPT15782.1 Stress response protein nst1 [Picochlorum sp. SENEW3]